MLLAMEEEPTNNVSSYLESPDYAQYADCFDTTAELDDNQILQQRLLRRHHEQAVGALVDLAFHDITHPGRGNAKFGIRAQREEP